MLHEFTFFISPSPSPSLSITSSIHPSPSLSISLSIVMGPIRLQREYVQQVHKTAMYTYVNCLT